MELFVRMVKQKCIIKYIYVAKILPLVDGDTMAEWLRRWS